MLGETVLAIGNAYGYEHSVTCGIVSSLSRDVEVNEKQSYENLIQTDASINPGNSGGPLINLDGEVIGINVAIRAGAQRIGFAIPIDDARRTIGQLLSIEQLDSTWHGVITEDLKSAAPRVDRAFDSPEQPGGNRRIASRRCDLESRRCRRHRWVDWERALLGHRVGRTGAGSCETRRQRSSIWKSSSSRERRTATPICPIVVARRGRAFDNRSRTWTMLGMNLAKLDRKTPRFKGRGIGAA